MPRKIRGGHDAPRQTIKVMLLIDNQAATLPLPPRLRNLILEAAEEDVKEGLRELLYLASEGSRD